MGRRGGRTYLEGGGSTQEGAECTAHGEGLLYG
jgi:hypothetical protein